VFFCISTDRSAGQTALDTATKRQKQPVQPPVQTQQPASTHSDDDEEEDSFEDTDSDEELSVPTTADLKTVIYSSDGKSSLGLSLVGGNAKGVFVDTIDPESAPAHAGLSAGQWC